MLVAGIVSSALNVVPFLGVVVGAFVGFFAAVAAYYVIGTTWADLHPVEPSEPETVGRSPVV